MSPGGRREGGRPWEDAGGCRDRYGVRGGHRGPPGVQVGCVKGHRGDAGRVECGGLKGKGNAGGCRKNSWLEKADRTEKL